MIEKQPSGLRIGTKTVGNKKEWAILQMYSDGTCMVLSTIEDPYIHRIQKGVKQ